MTRAARIPRVERIRGLLLAYEASMRLGEFDQAYAYAKQAEAIGWDVIKVAPQLADAAEMARILNYEAGFARRKDALPRPPHPVQQTSSSQHTGAI